MSAASADPEYPHMCWYTWCSGHQDSCSAAVVCYTSRLIINAFRPTALYSPVRYVRASADTGYPHVRVSPWAWMTIVSHETPAAAVWAGCSSAALSIDLNTVTTPSCILVWVFATYWRICKCCLSYLLIYLLTAIRIMRSHTHTLPPILSIATLDEWNSLQQHDDQVRKKFTVGIYDLYSTLICIALNATISVSNG